MANNFLTKEDYDRIVEVAKWNLALFHKIDIDFDVEIFVVIDKKLKKPIHRRKRKDKDVLICTSDLQNYEAMAYIIYELVRGWMHRNKMHIDELEYAEGKKGCGCKKRKEIAIEYSVNIMSKYVCEDKVESLKESLYKKDKFFF